METKVVMLLRQNGYAPGPLIGKGGYASCYLVEAMRYPGLTFVCKVMDAKNEKARQSYFSEVSLHLAVMNNYVINIYDHFVEGNMMIIIFEHCACGSMDKIIAGECPIPYEKLMVYTKQLLEGIEFMHRNHIAHHDIKPSNLYIDNNGRCKLGDLGISRRYKPGELSTQYNCTVSYASPEVLHTRPYDPYKADIWSLGMTLYQLSTGALPFSAKSKEEYLAIVTSGLIVRPENVPKKLTRLIMSCFQTNPALRPSAKDLLQFYFNGEDEGVRRKPRRLASYSYGFSGSILQIQPKEENKPTLCIWRNGRLAHHQSPPHISANSFSNIQKQESFI